MIAIARQAVPRGTPCEACNKPIRTDAHPKGWQRKYCDRRRCVRSRLKTAALAAYYRNHARNVARQRELYDPEKRRARYKALTPHQRAAWRVAQRRYRKANRAELNATKRATYNPADRRARYLSTGT